MPTVSSPPNNSSTNDIQINVRRTDVVLRPDPSRVLLRSFTPGAPARLERIITAIMSISEGEVGPMLDAISSKFSARHRQISNVFRDRFQQLHELVSIDDEVSEQRQLLIGSFFVSEFAVESAALFNPSMVVDPDQRDLPAGALRFILSLRATGDVSISSIVFRTGVIHADHQIEVMAATTSIVEPSQIPRPTYKKAILEQKLLELGLTNDYTRSVAEKLGESFTVEELASMIETELQEDTTKEGERDRQDSARRLLMLVKSHYSLQFLPEQGLSERVIFPVTAWQRNGLEDARFVRFQNDDGTYIYFATFTAFDGQLGIPQLLETSDFLRFGFNTLSGPAAQDKGMALFPKKINGRYAMLSRQDSESIHLMFADNIYFWEDPKILLKPELPWELVQIGNCGSPIETMAGWLVLSHGVGPGREYAMGAFLLDFNDPSRVIGRLRNPLMRSLPDEWEGNVPNVVYSCGALLHDGDLFIPYGVSDCATRFAIVRLDEVLAAMR